MQRPYFVIPAPVVFAVVVGIATLLDRLWPLNIPGGEGLFYGGWALIDTGMVFLLWTVWLMFWRKTTFNPYGKPQRLLSEGPFRVSRNPLYIGMLVTYIGVGLLWGNIWFFLLLPLLVAWLQFGIIRHEEQLLRKHFGEDYIEYCQKVRRWL